MADIRITPGGSMEAIGFGGSWETVPKGAAEEIQRLRDVLLAIEFMTATGDGIDPDATIEIHIIAAEGRSDDPCAWRADPAVIERLRASLRSVQ